ncbi:hypothetical protein PMAYCL1PPCAC_27550, partial [Pristionchus mayeri]
GNLSRKTSTMRRKDEIQIGKLQRKFQSIAQLQAIIPADCTLTMMFWECLLSERDFLMHTLVLPVLLAPDRPCLSLEHVSVRLDSGVKMRTINDVLRGCLEGRVGELKSE